MSDTKKISHNPWEEVYNLEGPASSYIGCSDDEEEAAEPFSLLIYGGGGDLSRKKLLPNLFHLHVHKWLPKEYSIVCAGSPQDSDTESFRLLVQESLKEHSTKDYSEDAWQSFAPHIHFIPLRFENNERFQALKDLVQETYPQKNPQVYKILHFLAVPPKAFETIVQQIKAFNMNTGNWTSRLIIEKPFGIDLSSAQQLNALLADVFKEDQIFRIDHYLGKETVQNIMFFRFSNSMFEPLWNNRYIDNVQITVAEDIGIEKRGKFYDPSGVIRDIIQNHALQLLTLVAMEPPVSFEANNIRDEKAKVCKSLSFLSPEEIKRDTLVGQYSSGKVASGKEAGQLLKAYREEDFVDPESSTPTFFAGKFTLNNWRWAGVPFYIRAGKRLGKRLTDIVIEFKKAPQQLFGQCQNREPGTLTLSLQPEESITMRYEVKYPNTLKRVWPVAMTFSYDKEFKVESLPAYARLILDALKGDLSLFVRQDSIEAMWNFIDPVIQTWNTEGNEGIKFYKPGNSGPQEARELLERDGRHWHTNLNADTGTIK